MIDELRIYEALPALHERFRTGPLKLFEKHGIRQLGFWTTSVGPSTNTLTYILQWEELTERQRRWDAFTVDPDWHAVRGQMPGVSRIWAVSLPGFPLP